MAKRKKIIVIIATVVTVSGAALWKLVPGLWRCHWYHKFITTIPYATSTLSKKPTIIQLPVNESADSLSFGFAQVCIIPQLINSIRCPEDTTCVIIKYKKSTVAFMEPFNISEDMFAVEVKAAQVKPKSYPEILLMPTEEFHIYMTLAFVKSMSDYNENGIGIFKTQHIKGLVRFGKPDSPGRILADVYSRDSKILQAIFVHSDPPEKSKEILFELLASYRFLITEVPEEDVLRKLIVAELEKNDKFEKNQ